MTRVRGTTKSKGKKHTLDKFYTETPAAEACLELLELSAYTKIIEPSAGNGAFSSLLVKKISTKQKLVCMDIAPENPEIVKQNWFTYKEKEKRTLVVGNPPFGVHGSLALEFINHAFETVEAQTVAFILPRSFRKPSMYGKIHSYAHLKEELILPEQSFTLQNQPYKLKTVFQIWELGQTRRRAETRSTQSKQADFVKAEDKHDFVIRRVGGRAGEAYISKNKVSKETHYFLRTKPGSDTRELLEKVNSHVFLNREDTVGPNCISKADVVEALDGVPRRQVVG